MQNPPSPSEIGRLWFENVWNERDHQLARKLMAEDAVGHLEGGLKVVGLEAFFAFQEEFFAAMPDIKIDVMETLSADGGVCVRWQAKGTHSGPAWGMVPSGNVVTFEGVTWFHTKDGQIIDGRDFWNLGGFMQKLSMPVEAA
jgi:steroid delta-isomerase-like uncharacterized protein